MGQWVARALLDRGDRLWLAGPGGRPAAPAILTAAEWGRVTWMSADIRNDREIEALFAAAAPDLVFHLAGISSVPAAEAMPAAAFDINAVGAVRLLDIAVRARDRGVSDPTVLVVGSGTQYGEQPRDAMPLTETTPQRPSNVYAASKAAQEIAALQVARRTGLRVVCTRSFNHSGRGHAAEYLLPSLVARAATMTDGETVRIGNDVIRDYLHVADVVTAYLALADRGVSGEAYNVCSGIGVSVSELAMAAMARAGKRGSVESDPALRRPSDMPVLVGSPAKLMAATGWRPVKTSRDIIEDLLSAE